MKSEPRRPLAASEVFHLATKLAETEATFIIGGQAINLWAWHYAKALPELRSLGLFTSEDIDVFGGPQAAKALADALKGRLELPTIDDVTPNTALVKATINGREVVIDFLNDVVGVEHWALRRGMVELILTAKIGDEERDIPVRLLHPIQCLKSRIGNILKLGRTDQLSRMQLQAALLVSKQHIDDALAEGTRDGWRDARDSLKELYHYLRRHELGRKVHLKLGVDPLDIIHGFCEDERIDGRFRRRQMAAMIRTINKKRRWDSS